MYRKRWGSVSSVCASSCLLLHPLLTGITMLMFLLAVAVVASSFPLTPRNHSVYAFTGDLSAFVHKRQLSLPCFAVASSPFIELHERDLRLQRLPRSLLALDAIR